MPQSQLTSPDPGRGARRLRRLLAVAVVGAAVGVAVPSAIGGTGIGAVFNLGRTNTVNGGTTLTGTTSSTSLRIINKGTGSGLSITTGSSVAPFRVSSSTKVPNLNADKLDGIDSGSFVRDTGVVVVNADPSTWRATNAAAPITADHGLAEYTRFERTASGYNYLRIGAVLPVGLFGEQMALTGIELCYGASANAVLSDVWVFHSVAATGTGATAQAFLDSTDRTDNTCRRYTLATPLALATTDMISVRVGVSWVLADAGFLAGRTSLFLAPTGVPVVSSAGTTEVAPLVVAPASEPVEDE